MDELDEISRRMLVSNLEAKLSLLDMDIAALVCEINSRLTTRERLIEARDSLDALRSQQANMLIELDQMSPAYQDIRH